ncbi:MAG: phosphohistidine phosphatase SixA [Acidobacteriota bacterium]
MILHLLRHAEAEDLSPSGRDADRRLTEDGRRRMKSVAKVIARMDPGYDAILVSPLVRARQTADPVAEACGFRKPLVETKALEPNADPVDILHELARLKPGTVLLVGHQPHFGRLFGLLLSGRSSLEVPMKKAAFAAFDAEADPSMGRAELKFYLPARLLEELS